MPQQPKTAPKRWIAVLGAALLVSGAVFGGQAGMDQAQAVSGLPTWDDVQAAKRNASAAAAKVKEIKELIAQSEDELTRLRNASAEALTRAQKAEQALQDAAAKSTLLDSQAKQSRKEAKAATKQASSLVSQMYRSGGVDRSLELFLETDGDTADALLENLASIEKATERNTAVSEKAEQAKNTAESLGEQAKVARAERKKLKDKRDREYTAAAEAAAAQQEKVNAQQDRQDVLRAQLAALEDKKSKTVDGYKERLRREEIARKKAEEEAKRRQQQQNNGGGGGGGGGNNNGGGGGGGGGGAGGNNGWIRPVNGGWISTYYLGYPGHYAVDIAEACYTPIYAARGGTVSFLGWGGNYGNFTAIDHGGGYTTRYAHQSRFAVSYGQHVSQGQLIGYVGTTGNSTGCHLHYEVLINGVFQNPIPRFMTG